MFFLHFCLQFDIYTTITVRTIRINFVEMSADYERQLQKGATLRKLIIARCAQLQNEQKTCECVATFLREYVNNPVKPRR